MTTQNLLRTRSVTPTKDVIRNWHLVDAKGQTLGRLSTEVSRLLRGRHKVNWSPMQDQGDHVVVVNAAKFQLTGNKMEMKKYYHHSTYPGHLKTTDLKTLLAERPTEALRKAVYGMLPKTKHRQPMLRRLHLFADEQHTFSNKFAK